MTDINQKHIIVIRVSESYGYFDTEVLGAYPTFLEAYKSQEYDDVALFAIDSESLKDYGWLNVQYEMFKEQLLLFKQGHSIKGQILYLLENHGHVLDGSITEQGLELIENAND